MKTKPYRVEPGEKLDLAKRPTRVDPVYDDKTDYKKKLDEHVAGLADLQQKLYADSRNALLIVFQAMDAAGKDGAIGHVMSGVNPQGCQVYSFKHPSATELEHDFLWRIQPCLPARGMIGIFNRSHYEEVLIVRVHPELLLAEDLPDADHPHWKDRYKSIADFEAHLSRTGTKVIKFFLHLSKEEQRRRFLDRIEVADKNWKFNPADLTERECWDDYQKAYEAALSATSTKDSPWYVVPADDKKTARLLVSRIILDALQELAPSYPEIDDARRRDLALAKEKLEAED